jgi:hypothetical protein
MAESNAVRTKQDGIITITNGVLTYIISKEAGDLNASIPGFNVTAPLDRGRFTASPTIRRGDDQPMTGSFTAYLRDFPNATDLTLMDVCMALSGTAGAGATSTTSDSDVMTWTMTYTIDGTPLGDADQTATYPNTFFTCSLAEGDPSVLTVNWTSYQPFPTFS